MIIRSFLVNKYTHFTRYNSTSVSFSGDNYICPTSIYFF